MAENNGHESDRYEPQDQALQQEDKSQGDMASISQDEKNWAMFCHIGVFAGFIIPFGNLIAPMVLWLMKKDEMPFVNFHGKEVINFQLTILIAVVVSWLLIFIVIGFLLLAVIGVFVVIVTIMGIVKTSQGEYYHYPLAIRFIK